MCACESYQSVHEYLEFTNHTTWLLASQCRVDITSEKKGLEKSILLDRRFFFFVLYLAAKSSGDGYICGRFFLFPFEGKKKKVRKRHSPKFPTNLPGLKFTERTSPPHSYILCISPVDLDVDWFRSSQVAVTDESSWCLIFCIHTFISLESIW